VLRFAQPSQSPETLAVIISTMAEELYFFKLDAEKARSELIKQLEIDDQFSYQKYINNYSDENLSFDEVTKKIKENIELLSIEEFWSISNWYSDRIENYYPNYDYDERQKLVDNSMSASGMDLFYEILSKTPVRKFHHILGDYESHMETDIIYPLVDNVCKSSDFNNFLKYGICFSGELSIFINDNYYKEGIEGALEFQKEIDDINLKYGNNYHKMALRELRKQLEYNLETMRLIPTLLEFRRSTAHLSIVTYPTEISEISNREGKLLDFASSFYNFIALKSVTDSYSGKILMLHSY